MLYLFIVLSCFEAVVAQEAFINVKPVKDVIVVLEVELYEVELFGTGVEKTTEVYFKSNMPEVTKYQQHFGTLKYNTITTDVCLYRANVLQACLNNGVYNFDYIEFVDNINPLVSKYLEYKWKQYQTPKKS